MQLWEVQRSVQPANLNLLLLITAAWVISSAIYVAWLTLLEFQILTDFETGMCQNQTVTSQMLFYSLTPALVESGSWSCQKLALTRRKAFWSDAEEGSIQEGKKAHFQNWDLKKPEKLAHSLQKQHIELLLHQLRSIPGLSLPTIICIKYLPLLLWVHLQSCLLVWGPAIVAATKPLLIPQHVSIRTSDVIRHLRVAVVSCQIIIVFFLNTAAHSRGTLLLFLTCSCGCGGGGGKTVGTWKRSRQEAGGLGDFVRKFVLNSHFLWLCWASWPGSTRTNP